MNNSLVKPITTKANYAWNDGEDDGQDGKLAPPSTKIKSESINLFELLEDRNSYQGCNRVLFLFILFFTIYQVMIHANHNTDIAATKNIIKRKLIVPRDEFEERDFNAWSINLMKNIIEDPLFFTKKIKLMRISFEFEYTLCNNTYHYPKQGSPNSRLKMKGYGENVCPWEIGQIGNRNRALQDPSVKQYLKDKYGLLSAKDPNYFNTRNNLLFVVYSAELKPVNRSQIAMQQLQSMESALKNESKSLRIGHLHIELFDPFDQHFFWCQVFTDDETSKSLNVGVWPINVAPNIENKDLVLWFIILYVLHIVFACEYFVRTSEVLKSTKSKEPAVAPLRQ